MIEDVDVCVVGAGPAGSCLAAKLAQLDYRVAVVEQRMFPRDHVGESLSRGAWPLLESLGVGRQAVESVGRPVRSAQVRWTFAAAEPAPSGGWTIDRGRFDRVLLDHAREAGAEIRHGRAHRPQRIPPGWRVRLAENVIHARFLADATGRAALLRGSRMATSARTIALHARWPCSAASLPDTLVCALPDGWAWCARLPGRDVRAMVLVDPVMLSVEDDPPARLFRRLLASIDMPTDVLRTLPAETNVSVCDAGSYRFDEVITRDFIRVGEAAFAVDPLSSSGIHMAIQTGLAAAAAVHTILSPDGDHPAALEYYRDLITSSVAHHGATAGRAYAQHTEYAHREFWRRRRLMDKPVGKQQLSSDADIGPLLSRRVRLRDTAHLRPVACRVGEGVEHRRALLAPNIDRPVAFLDGIALAPLIDEIESAPSLAAALSRLGQSLPLQRGYDFVAWLNDRQLLEVADN